MRVGFRFVGPVGDGTFCFLFLEKESGKEGETLEGKSIRAVLLRVLVAGAKALNASITCETGLKNSH